MSRLYTICNIKPIRFHCFQCSHPIYFSFFGSFPSGMEKIRKKNLFRIEKWKKNRTVPEKLKQENIMSETMSPYTFPKETGIQQMSKDCHVLLSIKAVENSLVINY